MTIWTHSPLNEVQHKLVRRLRDRRAKNVVFLSHCILNENTRYLGGACRAACIPEIVQQCMDNDLGMVQMPCPEQFAWGGVLKRLFLFAYGLKQRYPLVYRARHLVLPLALVYTRWIYRRMAQDVAGQIADYLSSGFSVVGVVGIDGSPSCAVNTTVDVDCLNALFAIPGESITVEEQNRLLSRFAKRGRGIFIDELQNALAHKGIHIDFFAHDVFAELEGRTSNVVLPKDALWRETSGASGRAI